MLCEFAEHSVGPNGGARPPASSERAAPCAPSCIGQHQRKGARLDALRGCPCPRSHRAKNFSEGTRDLSRYSRCQRETQTAALRGVRRAAGDPDLARRQGPAQD